MEPIRVAQVIGKMNTGGVKSIVMEYYRRMDRTRVQFDFFVDEDSRDVPHEEIEAMGGRVFVVPPYQRLPAYLSALTRLFRAQKYAIVHAHINTMCVFPLFAAWRAGVPVRVCHNHSTAHKGEGLRSVLKYALRPFARVFATDYFACGALAAEWLYGKRRVARGEVMILPNAIDAPAFAFDPAARARLRTELQIAQDAFVVGHIGRFMYQKNHAQLLRIFAAVQAQRPGAALLLVGEGELLEQTRALVRELRLENVIFAGRRTDANLLYSAMDVFCLPSFYEGLPVVASEAQASGLPCVFSTEVTAEAGMTELARFLPLTASDAQWAQAVISGGDLPRRSYTQEIRDAGFDSNTQGLRLLACYEKALARR